MISTLLRLIPHKTWRQKALDAWGADAPRIAVLRLAGTIGPNAPLRGGLNLAGLAEDIEQAFTMRGVKAVALAINSPGGSPVQSALIYRRIRALADENELPVFAFAEDVAASGGYWLACAGDEIYADESSIVGSIGVIMAGFGFHEALAKLGIERRIHAAGDNKAMLDPFKPEKPEDVQHLEALQRDVHAAFKDLVRTRRAGKLTASEETLFNGAFWAGRQAKALGLIDGIGDLRGVLREKYGERVRLILVGAGKPWWRRKPAAFVRKSELAEPERLASGLLAALEDRSLWSRFGL